MFFVDFVPSIYCDATKQSLISSSDHIYTVMDNEHYTVK